MSDEGLVASCVGECFFLGTDNSKEKTLPKIDELTNKGKQVGAIHRKPPSKLRILAEFGEIIALAVVIGVNLTAELRTIDSLQGQTNVTEEDIGQLLADGIATALGWFIAVASVLLLLNHLSDFENLIYSHYIKKEDGYWIYADTRHMTLEENKICTPCSKECLPDKAEVTTLDNHQRHVLLGNYMVDLLLACFIFATSIGCLASIFGITITACSAPIYCVCPFFDPLTATISGFEIGLSLAKIYFTIDIRSLQIFCLSYCGLAVIFKTIIVDLVVIPLTLPAVLLRISIVSYNSLKYADWFPCESCETGDIVEEIATSGS